MSLHRLLILLGGPEETQLFVTDRASGTTARVETRDPIPAPFACCGATFNDGRCGWLLRAALRRGRGHGRRSPMDCGDEPSPAP